MVNLQCCVRAKSLQSYLTLCNSIDHSPPGSSVHGMPSSRGSSRPRDQTHVSVAPALQADSLLLSHWGSWIYNKWWRIFNPTSKLTFCVSFYSGTLWLTACILMYQTPVDVCGHCGNWANPELPGPSEGLNCVTITKARLGAAAAVFDSVDWNLELIDVSSCQTLARHIALSLLLCLSVS